jgi:hypothetical protein
VAVGNQPDNGHCCQAPGHGKKKLMPELVQLAKGKGTTEPHLVGIFTAQKINQLCGGVVVTPWNCNDLPDEWLDSFSALANDYPAVRDQQAKVAQKLAELKRGK